MQAIRGALAAGEEDRLPGLMSDRWLTEVTLRFAGCGASRRCRGISPNWAVPLGSLPS